MRYATIIIAIAITALGGAAALAVLNPDPTGFGPFKFRATIDEVHKAHPAIRKNSGVRKSGVPNHPKIEEFVLAEQKVDGLEKATEVNLVFWDRKLWIVVVHYGDNDAGKVEALLQRRYGAPDVRLAHSLMWKGKKAAIVANRHFKYFDVHDERITAEVAQDFGRIVAENSGVAPATRAAAATASAAARAPTPKNTTPTPKSVTPTR